MSAWSGIQEDWTTKTELKEKTGILLWDLSAAFDTLDVEILCKKLMLYGLDDNSVNWFRSFLTNRSQKVKIGSHISNSVKLSLGVPQGGILSPLVFVLYVSDLEDWLEFSAAFTYADDTSSSVSGKDLDEVIRKMEIDAINVLKFMASNGLVANPKKTTMLFLNLGRNDNKNITIKIGKDEIHPVHQAKLLGINFDDNQKWDSQINGKGGIVSSLNQRLFFIRRLANSVNKSALKKVADSIFTSKIRYGLQLLGKVRWLETDIYTQDLKNIQLTQNKLARLLNGKKLIDKVNTKMLLDNLNMLSVNQINAQIKITEAWKNSQDIDHPLKFKKVSNNCHTRATANGDMIEFGKSDLVKSSFLSDASKAWNKTPMEIKECNTLWSAKKAIKTFVKQLPI